MASISEIYQCDQICVDGRALVLIGADEYTGNYMESAAALRGKQLSKASVA